MGLLTDDLWCEILVNGMMDQVDEVDKCLGGGKEIPGKVFVLVRGKVL